MIMEYFDKFDEDKNGFIDRKELRHFLTMFFKQYHMHLPMTDEFVDSVFRGMDTNHDNKIQPEELIGYSGHFIKELVAVYEQAAASAGLEAGAAEETKDQ